MPMCKQSLQNILPSVLVLALLLSAALGWANLVKAGTAEVKFVAVGPAGLKIEGKTTELALQDDGTALTIRVPLANLTTGIGLRDNHLKNKYLEIEKYPNAELVVVRATLASAGAETQAQGVLKIHGQSRNTEFRYTAKRNGSGYDVTGRLHLNVKDFGIQIPSYLGVTVKPEVEVFVRFSATGI